MSVKDVTEAGIVHLLDLAAATPQRLTAVTTGLSEDQLSQPLAPDEWSVLEILNHLRACEEVWMHSVMAMLAHQSPSLKEIHPREWIKQHNPYTRLNFASSLRQFVLQREALLIVLRDLAIADWARGAHIDGKVHTVYSHVRRMTLHEERHCNDIEAALTSN